jgi:Ca-activated chloride channel homolog
MENEAPLRISLESTMARVPVTTRKLAVVVELVAGDLPAERTRPDLWTMLVIDVSGSMTGPPLEQVARSVDRILDLLSETDRVGVVAFSTSATLVAPVAPLDANTKRALRSRVTRLRADDRTNIQAGLELGVAELPTTVSDNTRTAVVLLSDGQPNVGECSREGLGDIARGLRSRAAISTLGYGARHDEGVLLSLAESGGGCYRFIADPALCQLELAQAVGAQADIAVEGIEVTLCPRPGVEISAVIGASPPRYTKDGLLVAVPDLPAKAARTLLVELTVDLSDASLHGSLFELAARYRRAGERTSHTLDSEASVDVGGDTPMPHAEAFAKALLVRADRVRADARDLADRGQFDGAAALLRAFMREIDAAPGYKAGDGSALGEAWEQLLDEAMAMERRPGAEQLTTLKASTAMKSLAYDGVVASSRPLGRLTRNITGVLAGNVPEAYLVGVSGTAIGLKHRIQTQNTLGRTHSADVVLPSGQISRRHADVFVVAGSFFIADLGSTNVTAVNGKHIGRSPEKLSHGDVIKVGDAELRFELVAPKNGSEHP